MARFYLIFTQVLLICFGSFEVQAMGVRGGPELTIKKKRIHVACEVCRKAKKRCDGKEPCARCKTEPKKDCIYTPFLKRGPKSTPSPKETDPLQDLLKERQKWMNIYVEALQNIAEIDIQISLLGTQISPSKIQTLTDDELLELIKQSGPDSF